MKFAGGVGRVFHRRLGLREGSGAKSAVFQVTSCACPRDIPLALGSLGCPVPPLSTVPERRQKGSIRGFGRKWAIVHRIINGELMSDTIFFFRLLNPGLWWTFIPSLEVLTPKHAKSVTGTGPLWRTDLGKPSVCNICVCCATMFSSHPCHMRCDERIAAAAARACT